ncbi:hypothetical protein DSECCO2_362410 [anaerobic digester metagenome]
MKTIYNKTFYSCLLLLAMIGCKMDHVKQSNKRYKDYKSEYSKEYTNHFPEEILSKGVSFGGPLPTALDRRHYWGLELFAQYEDDQQKDFYIAQANLYLTNPLKVSGNDVVFLTNVKEFCDSNQSNIQYKVFPLPNVQLEVQMLNEAVFYDEIVYSKDWKDYQFFLIEHKDTIIYEEQRTNCCPLLQSELSHGFSRGVVVNEKDKFLFFWLYFW